MAKCLPLPCYFIVLSQLQMLGIWCVVLWQQLGQFLLP
jgi:hypothetical protein